MQASKKIESRRIGEAANSGPGLHDKQHKQLKLGELFIRSQTQIDSKSEWCEALGYRIHNIKGDGNCLYTCLGKELEMTGNQVRQSIIANANLYWNDMFEFEIEGEEFINFLSGTGDRNQWGGARQIVIFAKMGNIKIEVHSHGIPCQIYEFDSNDEQNKNTISVLWCNISKWGAQENHYDLLLPIKEENNHEKTPKEQLVENHEAFNNKCNWEANITSNYI
eukprot:8954373-Heterocapsa_arctica.AAC.1